MWNKIIRLRKRNFPFYDSEFTILFGLLTLHVRFEFQTFHMWKDHEIFTKSFKFYVNPQTTHGSIDDYFSYNFLSWCLHLFRVSKRFFFSSMNHRVVKFLEFNWKIWFLKLLKASTWGVIELWKEFPIPSYQISIFLHPRKTSWKFKFYFLKVFPSVTGYCR